MRKFISLLSFSGLFFITSCTTSTGSGTAGNTAPVTPAPIQSTPSVAATPRIGDGVTRISIADAKKDFDAGGALFVDTHSPEQFASQHIKGAMNIPANDIGTKADMIPKGKKIIAYCS